MSKGRGRQRVDRKARAAANGYNRGAHREQDKERCEIIYSDDSIAMQDRVISVYIEYVYIISPCPVACDHLADFLSVLPSSWASEEDESLREKGLQKGYPIPNLATIKDFVRFYVSSTDGILTLRPTKSSVLNFAERFFAGYTRITKSVFDKKDSDDVYTVRNPSIEYLSMVTERK